MKNHLHMSVWLLATSSSFQMDAGSITREIQPPSVVCSSFMKSTNQTWLCCLLGTITRWDQRRLPLPPTCSKSTTLFLCTMESPDRQELPVHFEMHSMPSASTLSK